MDFIIINKVIIIVNDTIYKTQFLETMKLERYIDTINFTLKKYPGASTIFTKYKNPMSFTIIKDNVGNCFTADLSQLEA
jgi:hypothetical protein